MAGRTPSGEATHGEDAATDHQPVVAIVGQQARTALGGSYQQEVDLTTLSRCR